MQRGFFLGFFPGLALVIASLLGAAAAHAFVGPTLSGALGLAGERRAAWEHVLSNAPASQRRSLEFLVTHMPATDLTSVDLGMVVTNTTLAHEAMASAPWAARIPEDLFLNDILPYACVNEARENWRPRLREIALPLVRDCTSPGEAARRLNERLFPLLKVGYNTKRRRPDQAPLETMASGMATCTGLSILLADACRAVGVPARIAGTPLWANMRGNHTWVEVWDGDWHFLGAAEPDPAGLDRGWFVHDASQARADEPRHAIYASSFRQTGLSFPLVWARSIPWVPAVNVTARYTPKSSAPDAAPNHTRLLVKVLDQPAGRRVRAHVVVLDDLDASRSWIGSSRDESADMNDILPVEVPSGRSFRILATRDWTTAETRVGPVNGKETVVVLPLDGRRFLSVPSQACYQPGTNRPASRFLPVP